MQRQTLLVSLVSTTLVTKALAR